MPDQQQESDTPPSPPLRGRGGRPKLADGSARGVTIGVRVSLGEYLALADKAAEMGVKPAAFLRSAALLRRLPSPPAPVANVAAFAQLGRLASNLNQLAKAANAGRATVDSEILETLLAEVRQLQSTLKGRPR